MRRLFWIGVFFGLFLGKVSYAQSSWSGQIQGSMVWSRWLGDLMPRDGSSRPGFLGIRVEKDLVSSAGYGHLGFSSTAAAGMSSISTQSFYWGGGPLYSLMLREGQSVVPFLGWEWNGFYYSSQKWGWNHFFSQGWRAGALISLGAWDLDRSEKLAQKTGIHRTDLSLEVKKWNGDDGVVFLSGISLAAGIRFEFR